MPKEEKALGEQQQKFVDAYCAEGSSTFMDKFKSYEAVYQTESKHWKSNATTLYKKNKIQEAIRKQMPKVAYELHHLRKEVWDRYQEAVADQNHTAIHKYLDMMMKTENAYKDTGNTEDVSAKVKEEFDKRTRETLEKIQAEKERRREFKLVEKNGTDNT